MTLEIAGCAKLLVCNSRTEPVLDHFFFPSLYYFHMHIAHALLLLSIHQFSLCNVFSSIAHKVIAHLVFLPITIEIKPELCQLLWAFRLPQMVSMWFVISSQHSESCVGLYLLIKWSTPILTCKIGTGTACEVPICALIWLTSSQCELFSARVHSIPGVLVHQDPFCNSHFIIRPFICALPSKNTRIRNHNAQLQTTPGGAGL